MVGVHLLLLRNTLAGLFLCSSGHHRSCSISSAGAFCHHLRGTDRRRRTKSATTTTVAAAAAAAAAARMLMTSMTTFDDNNTNDPTRSNHLSTTYNNGHQNSTETKTWLVVGDGDLSYSSSISSRLHKSGIQLIATVLEDEITHNKVYENSHSNAQKIITAARQDNTKSHHKVLFGVDATKLETTTFLNGEKFDIIEFNFPHWRGKTNTKYNRQLLQDFLKSAKTVLNPMGGEIRIALCSGQGGMMTMMPTTTKQSSSGTTLLQQWRQSWMPAVYAANEGLLLREVEPFEANYQLSSHRGVDRPFNIGKEPQRYIFTFPPENEKKLCNDEESVVVDRHIQLSCRHELRIMLHPDKFNNNNNNYNDSNDDNSPPSITREDIVHGNAVYELAKEFVPTGYRLEIPARDVLTPYDLKKPDHVPLAVFLLNYSGETQPLTRDIADSIRDNIETSIKQRWKLEIAKAGRLVSRPYPYSLLPTLIKEYNREEEQPSQADPPSLPQSKHTPPPPPPTTQHVISIEEVDDSDNVISFASSRSESD